MEFVPPTQYATDDNCGPVNVSGAQHPSAGVPLYPWVIALAELRGGERVLEVGCGNGNYLALVDATGLDMSTGMLAAAGSEPSVRSSVATCSTCRFPPIPSTWSWRRTCCITSMTVEPPLRSSDEWSSPAAMHRRHERRREPCGACAARRRGRRSRLAMAPTVGRRVQSRERRPATSTAFTHVDRVDCPPGVVLVEDADALAAYLASVGDHYELDVLKWTTWTRWWPSVAAAPAEVIQEQGAFVISSSVGAFVCH